MVFRKFVEWVISWARYSIHGLSQRNAGHSQTELLKRIQELEKLVSHMSTENEEMQMAFFRNIYHEIRTPMNAILGFSSLLEDQRLSEEKKDHYAEQVWNSGAVFLQFMDDLVETSMLETRKTELVYSVFSMKEVMHEVYQVCNRHRHITDKKCIALLMAKHTDERDVYVETDRQRLTRLVEYITTGFMMDHDMGVVELGYKVALNNSLAFCVKSFPVRRILADPKELGVTRSFYDLSLRRRSADKLVHLFRGTISFEPNKSGGQTARLIIKPKRLSYTNPLECNENDKRMAI